MRTCYSAQSRESTAMEMRVREWAAGGAIEGIYMTQRDGGTAQYGLWSSEPASSGRQAAGRQASRVTVSNFPGSLPQPEPCALSRSVPPTGTAISATPVSTLRDIAARPHASAVDHSLALKLETAC